MKLLLHLPLVTVLLTVPAVAATTTWYANLTPGAELTSTGSPAPLVLNGATPTGFGQVTFDDSTNVLSINMSWQGLTGTANAAHIHCCATNPPFTAGVVLGLWNPPMGPALGSSGSYSNTWDLDTQNPFTSAAFVTNNGGTPLQAFLTALAPAMNAGTPNLGRAYLNIHTTLNPGGEIRGNLAPVPEPATFLLSGAAFAGLLVARRYRSR